jgi:hypothetical protein
MGGVDLDRESVERRDFPIARRGYSPPAVDAHLRAVAEGIEGLRRAAAAPGGDSLGDAAAAQVRSIIEAAEAAAADIRNRAQANAGSARTDADRDAETMRTEAAAQAQAHVAAVAEASAALRGRIESIEKDLGALFGSLRDGATRLAAELTDVETSLGGLYEGTSDTAPAPEEGSGSLAASGTAAESIGPGAGRESSGEASGPSGKEPAPSRKESAPSRKESAPSRKEPAPSGKESAPSRKESIPPGAASGPSGDTAGPGDAPPAETGRPLAAATPASGGPAAEENGDLDGARLTVLNMALSGESRERAGRYLAEHFRLPDREKLIDEVYAAVER